MPKLDQGLVLTQCVKENNFDRSFRYKWRRKKDYTSRVLAAYDHEVRRPFASKHGAQDAENASAIDTKGKEHAQLRGVQVFLLPATAALPHKRTIA